MPGTVLVSRYRPSLSRLPDCTRKLASTASIFLAYARHEKARKQENGQIITKVDTLPRTLEWYIQVFLDALIFGFRFVTSLAIRGLAGSRTVFGFSSSACPVAVPAKQHDVLSNYLGDVPFYTVLVVVGTRLQSSLDIHLGPPDKVGGQVLHLPDHDGHPICLLMHLLVGIGPLTIHCQRDA